MELKIFLVTVEDDFIDSVGDETEILVIAESEEEAIEKVKDGWFVRYDNGCVVYGDPKTDGFDIDKLDLIRAKEVKFFMHDIHIVNRDTIIDEILESED